MPKGFFTKSQLASKAPVSRIPHCGSCGLFRQCKSPKMPVSGKGRKQILLVGEAPGKNEDLEGKQFVGKTGQLLERSLRSVGIDMRRDCWLTNALICRPPNNAKPSHKEIGYCRANLINTIEKLKPEIIIPIGDAAVESLMTWLWKDKIGSIGRWVGWNIPHQKLNAWICPIWHPSYIARQLDPNAKKKRPEVPIIWRKHLQQIGTLQGRPWDELPDYASRVQRIVNSHDAERWIESIVKRGTKNDYASFDFETNCLKPDWNDAEIISASICFNGKETAAFMWTPRVANAFKKFLRSPIRKIAANLKFEQRWSLKKLRVPVRNWWYDTMQGAHVMDCRRGITSIKFQAFVLLGQEPYNTAIEPLLKSKGGSKITQVAKEIDRGQLLTYNGLDSILEYDVCFIQRRIMGHE
jgi:uracil-DNA glycosylase family 4